MTTQMPSQPGTPQDVTGEPGGGGSPPESMEVESIAGVIELTGEERTELAGQAETIIGELRDASGSRELEVLDHLSGVGAETQRSAAAEVELLRTRVGSFLDEGGSSAQIADGLRALRLTLDAINPTELSRPPVHERLLSVLPGGRENRVVRALRRVALRYESVAAQVTIIETRLQDAQQLLLRDNVELRQIYADVEQQQQAVVRDAYLGEELVNRLAELAEETSDEQRRQRIVSARFDVVMRVQDLRTMQQVHEQFFASLQLTRENNNRLSQAVDRTVTTATNLVTVGLALQAALVRQRRVAEAAERTRTFLGELVTTNASAINQHTAEIGDLYSSPVIAIEKVEQAHRELSEALARASELRSLGVDTALANVEKLAALSSTVAGTGAVAERSTLA